MPDNPSDAAGALYPNLPRSLDPAPAQPDRDPSQAANSLYGNSPSGRGGKDGLSPLGGQAVRSTVFAAPDAARGGSVSEPANGGSNAEPATPFNPELAKLPEGMVADPALMGEYAGAAKELGLDHAGAQRLLDLHAKTQAAEAEHWNRTSEQWQAEVRAEIPAARLQAAYNLVHDSQLTDPELAKWLAESPAGNWAPLVRTLARYAEAMAAARSQRR
jgi:hypothetical protein